MPATKASTTKVPTPDQQRTIPDHRYAPAAPWYTEHVGTGEVWNAREPWVHNAQLWAGGEIPGITGKEAASEAYLAEMRRKKGVTGCVRVVRDSKKGSDGKSWKYQVVWEDR